jgi:hypothetical protein
MAQLRFVPSMSHQEATPPSRYINTPVGIVQVKALLFIPAVCTVDWHHPPLKIRDTYSHPAVLASFVVGYAIIPPENILEKTKNKH